MKVGIIYTLNEERAISYNPGDDIVKDGQKYLFEEEYSGEIEWDVLWRYHPGYWSDYIPEQISKLHPKYLWGAWPALPKKMFNRLRECDCVINASGPLLYSGKWYHSKFEPWFLVLKRAVKDSETKFVNLGFGTHFHSAENYKRNNIWAKLNNSFIKEISTISEVVASRENIADELMRKNNESSEGVIPCPSIMAKKYWSVEPDQKDYIAVNFHPKGTRVRKIDKSKDKGFVNIYERFIENIEDRGFDVKYVFHEELEYELAKKVLDLDGKDVIVPSSIPEFLRAYGEARAAITSRMHGAYAAASFGVPSISLGSDSRLGMIDLMDLPKVKLDSVTLEEMTKKFDKVIQNEKKWSKSLTRICEKSEDKYKQVLSGLTL